jgi:hypothetical protein
MVCSEKELGLSEAAEDILYLPDDTPVGVPLVDVLGDYVLNFNIKGPFGHLQSVYGIARELAALYGRPLKRDPLCDCDQAGPDARRARRLRGVGDRRSATLRALYGDDDPRCGDQALAALDAAAP